MIGDVLKSISAAGSLAIVGMLLFLVTFLGIVVWAVRLKRSVVETMKNLPLEAAAYEESERDD